MYNMEVEQRVGLPAQEQKNNKSVEDEKEAVKIGREDENNREIATRANKVPNLVKKNKLQCNRANGRTMGGLFGREFSSFSVFNASFSL